MKLLLISSVVPSNTISGNAILYRHLSNLGNIDLLVVSDGPVPGFRHDIIRHRIHSRVFKRLAKTQFSRWGCDFQEFCQPGNPPKVARIAKNFCPDIIMTVAHGDLWRLAVREARAGKLPLVTVFHDWWPDFAGVHRWMVPLLDKRFRALHQNSTVSMCVCEGMRDVLGPRSGDVILYPIPSRSQSLEKECAVTGRKEDRLRLLYMGNLGDYGGMIQRALQSTKEHSRVHLEVRGQNPSWPVAFRDEMQKRGLWHDFAPRDQLNQWLESAGAFLVAMRFETSMRRRMETSFPSKLVEYAQMGKPIVIWGPEYCSAVRWARVQDSALCVTDPSPLALVKAMELRTACEWNRLTAASRQAAATEFNPDMIQRQFLGTLHRAIELKSELCCTRKIGGSPRMRQL